LQEISHPFVVKYLEEFVYQDKLCIVTKFASGGDLDALMKKKKTFTEDEAMHYFTMILIALHYLHSKEIVHRDLKPANILIDELPGGVNILKIGDFSISKVDIQKMKKTVTATMGGQTSPAYIAPEVIRN
jgi:serine/threonine protein kinase